MKQGRPVLTKLRPPPLGNIVDASERFRPVPPPTAQLPSQPEKKRQSANNWLFALAILTVLIIIVALVAVNPTVKPEGREIILPTPISLPSESKNLPQPLSSTTAEIQPTTKPIIPPPTAQELLAKIETYLATGQEEETALEAAEQLLVIDEEISVKKAVVLVSQLSQATSLEPETLRLAKIIP